MNYPPLSSKIDPFIPLNEDKDYKPKQPDMEKVKHYKTIE